MSHKPNRKAIVFSALITAFLLTVAAGSYALWQGWGTPTVAAENVVPTAPALQTQQAQTMDNGTTAAYQAQLEQAYTALDEAYAQIETLQAAQTQAQTQTAGRLWEDDDDHAEHEAYESHEHEGREESEHEHDD